MYKKIMLSSFISLAMLASNVGCGKKSEQDAGQAQPRASASQNSTVTAEFAKDVDKAQAENVLSLLRSEFPQMNVARVENAPMKGFYQVLADGEVLYVSADNKLMLVGDVISLDKTRKSLTEEVRKAARLKLLQSLNDSDMVVFKPKKVDHVVTVFTDVDCGYCRKFHSEMQSYLDKGIEVRYMSFPRAGKNSESYNKAVTIWCSKNPQEAMNKAKLTDTFKADEKLCAKSAIVDRSLDIVRQLGLNGTPALLLEDGTILPGYMPADKLSSLLDENKKKNDALTHNGTGNTNAS